MRYTDTAHPFDTDDRPGDASPTTPREPPRRRPSTRPRVTQSKKSAPFRLPSRGQRLDPRERHPHAHHLGHRYIGPVTREFLSDSVAQ
jgi:hypothetical protein